MKVCLVNAEKNSGRKKENYFEKEKKKMLRKGLKIGRC